MITPSINPSTSSEAKSGFSGSQDTGYQGGAAGGNRGFVNNFAAQGASVAATDPINGPAFTGGIMAYVWPVLAVVGIVLAIKIWRHHGAR
jgi:hypothetical protein